MITQTPSKFHTLALNLLRIMAGFLFLPHGAQKLFGLFGGFGGQPGATAPLLSLMGVAGTLEFFGGLLVMCGLFTRPIAFILSGQMAAAYFMGHFPQGFWPLLNGGELAALYSFVFLLLAAGGGGDFGLDAILFPRKR
jgi:putative oxidoreductase